MTTSPVFAVGHRSWFYRFICVNQKNITTYWSNSVIHILVLQVREYLKNIHRPHRFFCLQDLDWMASWMTTCFVMAETAELHPTKKRTQGSFCCGRELDGRHREPPWRIKLASPVGQERGEQWMLLLGGSFPRSSLRYCTNPASPSSAATTPRVEAPHNSLISQMLWVKPLITVSWLIALPPNCYRIFPGGQNERKARG